MRIIFASHNEKKASEIRSILPQGITLLTLADLNYHQEIPEDEPTIEGNSAFKAQWVFKEFGLPCFADDTGLEVESLHGLPGVMSKRFSGSNYSAERNISKLLNMMKSSSNRKAKFKTVIALILNGELSVFSGVCEGEIIFTKKGLKGFGYDPVFKPNGHKFTFAEMDMEIKNTIGHRAKAVKKLIEFLTKK